MGFIVENWYSYNQGHNKFPFIDLGESFPAPHSFEFFGTLQDAHWLAGTFHNSSNFCTYRYRVGRLATLRQQKNLTE